MSRKGKLSTSWHILNGDQRLAHYVFPVYYILNWLNNRNREPKLGGKLPIRRFRADQLNSLLDYSQPISSPSRVVTDMFLASLPWKEIAAGVGKLNIADLGCGQGVYAELFERTCGSLLNSYSGYDHKKNLSWDKISDKNDRLSFLETASEDMASQLSTDINVIFSCSALEHFKADLGLFSDIRKFCDATNKSILQIHCVPAWPCLQLYGVHGIRQYTPRTIGLIWEKFQSDSNGMLYELSGRQCNRLHRKYITWPIRLRLGDQRYRKRIQYSNELLESIEEDMKGYDNEPGFYALVMHTKPGKLLSILK